MAKVISATEIFAVPWLHGKTTMDKLGKVLKDHASEKDLKSAFEKFKQASIVRV